jgi:hypothetical protein
MLKNFAKILSKNSGTNQPFSFSVEFLQAGKVAKA